ncbi:neuronal acetylcholine receptor subunit alpha-10-like [Ptychodera flava]|uniref:neuronal acetylcholine receptor subunit alpha-10-like n=1 Tax=Ptychodera flava TaxID=63121 RepID=UPI00396A8928
MVKIVGVAVPLFLVLCCCQAFADAQSNRTKSDLTSQLVKDLFQDHEHRRYIRPLLNDSKTVTVLHRMTPIQILNIDEQDQAIYMKVWMSQIWTDEFMLWDPSNYGGIDEIRVPISNLWQPDITLVNGVTPGFLRHYDTDAIISSDGKVTALQPDVLQATCKVDARYFPFDQQRCHFTFASWSYPLDKIDLVLDPGSNTKLFVSNGEWILLGMPKIRESVLDPCCPVPFPKLTYTMHLQRRSTFYIFNIVFPSYLASALVAVAFYLPSDSGERVTLWVTSMLSQFVFLNVLSEFMPPNSEHLPYLQRYFFSSIGLVAISSLVIGLTLSMHFKGPHCQRVPRWLRTLVFKYMAPLVCQKERAKRYVLQLKEKERRKRERRNSRKNFETYNHGYVHEVKPGEVDPHRTPNGVFIVDGGIHIAKMNSHDGADVGRSSSDDEDDCDRVSDISLYEERKRMNEWRAVARIIDRVYLIIYLISLTGLLVGYLTFLYVQSLDVPVYEEE